MLNTKMFTQILVLIFFATFARAQISALPGWNRCATGPNPATGVQIGVSGCTTTPCTFIKGHAYTFTVFATSPVNSSSISYIVTATYPDLCSYTILQGDACSLLLLGQCPAVTNNIYLAALTYNVEAYSPTGYAVIRITVMDSSNNVVICADFFAIISN